jgi:hypothetical protein
MSPEPVPAAEIEDELEVVDEGIDEVSEMLAVHSIVSEERHGEIIEGVEQCRESLQAIESQLQQSPASPSMELLLERTAQIAERLTNLETEVRSLRQSPTSAPSSSPQLPPSELPNPEDAGVLPVQRPTEVEPRNRPPLRKKNRFRLI